MCTEGDAGAISTIAALNVAELIFFKVAFLLELLLEQLCLRVEVLGQIISRELFDVMLHFIYSISQALHFLQQLLFIIQDFLNFRV